MSKIYYFQNGGIIGNPDMHKEKEPMKYEDHVKYWQDRYEQLRAEIKCGVVSFELLEEYGDAGFMVKISNDPARFLARVA